jgi:hypothetical protein
MIIQFPIRNAMIIQDMINKISTITPSISTYQKTVKNYIDYQATLALIRDLQIKKLKNIAANKKRRSKQIIRYTVINPKK